MVNVLGTWVCWEMIDWLGERLTISGSILLCGVAIVVSLFLLWRSERKQAAVGRRYVTSLSHLKNKHSLLIPMQGNAIVPSRLHHNRDMRNIHSWKISLE